MGDAFLLIWHPGKGTFRDLEKFVRDLRETGRAVEDWSVGSRKSLPKGSRLFLMRLGRPPKGIVGVGRSLSEKPYLGKHWDAERAKQGQRAMFVDVEFSCFADVDGGGDPLVPEDFLRAGALGGFEWTPQASGIEIPAAIASVLETVIGQDDWRLESGKGSAGKSLQEGNPQKRLATVYERSLVARRECLQHFGPSCRACGEDLRARYRGLSRVVVHVHHVRPISRGKREVDPVRDLVPLCPNCHAVAHSEAKPLSIARIQRMLGLAQKGRM